MTPPSTTPVTSRNADRYLFSMFKLLLLAVLGLFALLGMGYAILQFVVIQGQGVETQATVIALERERTRDGLHYNVRYVYTVDRRNYEGAGAISGADGAGLETMMPIRVRYLPFQPSISVPVRPVHTAFLPVNRRYVAYFLIAVGLAWYWRKQRR